MDVIVLVLPVPLVVKLQMNRRAKFGLFVVFLLGALCVILSPLDNFNSLTSL